MSRVHAISLIRELQVSLVPLTAAYAAGTVLSGVQTFVLSHTSAFIQSGRMLLGSGAFAAASSIDLVLFSALPSGVYTDGAAFTLAAADFALVAGVLHLTDVTGLGGAITLVQGQQLGQAIAGLFGAKTLYVLPVLRGAITFAAGAGDVAVLSLELTQ